MSAKKVQSDITFAEIDELVLGYLRARDWDRLPERALAISIALEANELLEHYQWSDEAVGNREALAEELADVLIYAFEFAQITGIDIAAAIRKKLEKADKKYPAEKFKGKTEQERKVAWIDTKLHHKKESL